MSNLGKWVNVWTAQPVTRSNVKHRQAQLKAAEVLSKVKGQKFPSVVYRSLELDVEKHRDWAKYLKSLNSRYPEATSGSVAGLKSFLRDAAGGNVKIDRAGFLFFAVLVDPRDCMFSVRSLAKMMSPEDLRTRDDAGFTVKEYLSQDEVVVRPGTLRNKLAAGKVYLVGYSPPRKDHVWFSKPKHVSLK